MEMIFNGIINDGEYFKEYLIREAKKALDSKVELKEFFSRCMGVCIYLRQQRQKEYKNSKEHWEAQKRIGLKSNLDTSKIEEILRSLNLAAYELSLFDLTDGKYSGTLSQSDIDTIANYIAEAVNYFSQEGSRPQRIKTERETSSKNDYYLRRVTIAYRLMGIVLAKENAEEVLRKHTILRSIPKLLSKGVTKVSELTKISENKTSDIKKLKDLKAADRLVNNR